jgi:hypothetical protein
VSRNDNAKAEVRRRNAEIGIVGCGRNWGGEWADGKYFFARDELQFLWKGTKPLLTLVEVGFCAQGFGKKENDFNPTIGYNFGGGLVIEWGAMKTEDRGWRFEESKDGASVRRDLRASDQSLPPHHAETVRLVFQTQPIFGDGDTLKRGHRAGRCCVSDRSREIEAVNKGDQRFSPANAGLDRFNLRGAWLPCVFFGFLRLFTHPGDFLFFAGPAEFAKTPGIYTAEKTGCRRRGGVV